MYIDKTNQKFNMLTARKYIGDGCWLCDCDCGKTNIRIRSCLLNEDPNRRKQKSCGCLREKNKPEHEDFFDKIDTEEKAYTLGFIAADGTVQPELNRIKIDIKDIDEDVLVKIQKAIGHTNKLSHYLYHNKKFNNSEEFYNVRISRLIISSKQMMLDAQKYGVIPNKTDKLKINFELIPEELYFHFIRGYFDGNGCLSFSREKNYNDLTYTGSTIFVSQLKQILELYTEGHLFYLTHRKPDNLENGTIISTYKYSNKIILDKMYENATIFLDRKFKKYQQFLAEYDF